MAEMVEILSLVLLYDEELVLNAVEEALRLEKPSKQHVLNCLHRLSEPAAPEPMAPIPHLNLTIEPRADNQRYDHLREVSHAHCPNH